MINLKKLGILCRQKSVIIKASYSKFVLINSPLYRLSNAIDWSSFDETFGKLYAVGMGRPAKPTRLMVGLHYLKHTFDLSDEEVVLQWVENPYWQYFCGCEYFEHEVPIDPSIMTKWRNRIKSDRLEKLLEETIRTVFK